MSPAKLPDHNYNYHHDHDHQRSRTREINGPRPSPLKISKDSHVIHKPSSSSFVSSSSNSSSSTSLSGLPHHGMNKLQPQPQRHPVIIYTHSPKVIHTQARDFMALVQKLTGFSRSDDETAQPQEAGGKTSKKPVGVGNHADNNDDQSLSSVLTDEKHGGDDHLRVTSSSLTVSPVMNLPPTNHFLADIPLFTPSSTDNFFCSPRPVLRFPEYASPSPNMANFVISPSVFEFIKQLPEC